MRLQSAAGAEQITQGDVQQAGEIPLLCARGWNITEKPVKAAGGSFHHPQQQTALVTLSPENLRLLDLLEIPQLGQTATDARDLARII